MSRIDFLLASLRKARRSKAFICSRFPSLLDSFLLSSSPRKSFSVVVSAKLLTPYHWNPDTPIG